MSPDVQVISSNGENLGILNLSDAIRKAKDEGLDLIEISPNSKPVLPGAGRNERISTGNHIGNKFSEKAKTGTGIPVNSFRKNKFKKKRPAESKIFSYKMPPSFSPSQLKKLKSELVKPSVPFVANGKPHSPFLWKQKSKISEQLLKSNKTNNSKNG